MARFRGRRQKKVWPQRKSDPDARVRRMIEEAFPRDPVIGKITPPVSAPLFRAPLTKDLGGPSEEPPAPRKAKARKIRAGGCTIIVVLKKRLEVSVATPLIVTVHVGIKRFNESRKKKEPRFDPYDVGMAVTPTNSILQITGCLDCWTSDAQKPLQAIVDIAAAIPDFDSLYVHVAGRIVQANVTVQGNGGASK